MKHNRAQNITRREWHEIMVHPLVGKTFSVRSHEYWDDFAGRVYGAKFVINDGLHDTYMLYTIVGEYGDGEVLMLKRVNGKLMPNKY